jgi:hypothetical protein
LQQTLSSWLPFQRGTLGSEQYQYSNSSLHRHTVLPTFMSVRLTFFKVFLKISSCSLLIRFMKKIQKNESLSSCFTGLGPSLMFAASLSLPVRGGLYCEVGRQLNTSRRWRCLQCGHREARWGLREGGRLGNGCSQAGGDEEHA